MEDGASVTDAMPDSGYTALHYAALSGKGIVINYLLKAGAEKNAKDASGMTAYDLALRWYCFKLQYIIKDKCEQSREARARPRKTETLDFTWGQNKLRNWQIETSQFPEEG